jgi:predicted nucleic acid-binding protein
VTRAYLDTPYLYLHFSTSVTSDTRFAAWKEAVVDAVGNDAMVISALAVDELAYRLILGWLRDDNDPDPLTTCRRAPAETTRSMGQRLRKLWDGLDALHLETAVATLAVIRRAQTFMTDPGLAPRDAFHAAHALASQCEIIVSADPDFDRVEELRRLGPGTKALS